MACPGGSGKEYTRFVTGDTGIYVGRCTVHRNWLPNRRDGGSMVIKHSWRREYNIYASFFNTLAKFICTWATFAFTSSLSRGNTHGGHFGPFPPLHSSYFQTNVTPSLMQLSRTRTGSYTLPQTLGWDKPLTCQATRLHYSASFFSNPSLLAIVINLG